jgi:hypothetical protein
MALSNDIHKSYEMQHGQKFSSTSRKIKSLKDHDETWKILKA